MLGLTFKRHAPVVLPVLSIVLSTLASRVARGADLSDLSDLVAPDARVEKVAGGFRFTEGPAFGPQGFLLFTDIPNDRIVEVAADGTVSDFMKPAGKANGLMFDRAGRLHACQGADGGARRVVHIDVRTRKVTVLADRFEGKKLNSPNDLALDHHGGLYFTDPRYGGAESREQPVMAVYYIDSSGKTTRVIDDLQRPNGILVSPRGRYLYVAEPNRRQVYRYEIRAPGKPGKGKLIFTADRELDGGGPDGMAHDERGNIYATYRGITVLNPAGKVIGRIPVPEHPSNCAFGGKKNRTLYITARTGLYSIPMKVTGMALQTGKAAVRTSKAKRGDSRRPFGAEESRRAIHR